MIHRCLHPDCVSEINQHNLVCVDHWKILPQEIKRAVQERRIGWQSKNEAEIYLANYYRAKERSQNVNPNS